MVCAAPWLFGSVDAWAELLLDVGVGVVVVVAALSGATSVRLRNVFGLPSLALGGLVVLAAAQAAPLPGPLYSFLDPEGARLRAALVPDTAERVVGDPSPPAPLAAATLSQSPGASLDTAARLGAAWLLFQGVVGLGGGCPALRRFAWVVAVNGAALALFALVQALTWNGKIYWTYPSPHGGAWSGGGPFVCHSHLAEYLNVCLGGALGLVLGGGRPGRRSNRSWAAYLVGVLALGVITSNSRGGFLAMLAAAALTVAGLRARGAGLWAGLAGSVGVLALLLLSLGDASPYVPRLATIFDREEKGYAIRSELWRESLQAWRDHPVWGTGLGAFPISAVPYLKTEHAVSFVHAEDEYVEMLVEGGAVGFALALACLAGIARRARRAMATAPSPADRVLVLGLGAGVVAVLLQCLGDFGLHVPGVAVAAVVACAYLCGVGGDGPSDPRAVGRGRRLFAALAVAAPAVLLAAHGVDLARAEALIAPTRLPLPDTMMPTHAYPDWDEAELTRTRDALESAVRLRPRWAEGRLRLGLVEMALYRATASEWLKESVPDAAERAVMSDPLWLLELVRAQKTEPAGLLKEEPVRRHLTPALRHFLEARRVCPVVALAHAELAALSWLMDSSAGGAAPHVRRGLATSGPDARVQAYLADVSVRSGEPALAAACWRRALETGAQDWVGIAQAASDALTPDQVLDDVIPERRGRYAWLFAERLFPRPEDRARRERFVRKAVASIPNDPGLPEPERLEMEGRARYDLGDAAGAVRCLNAALVLEPARFAWRKELIDWLLESDDPAEAHNQALQAAHFSGDRPETRLELDRTAEAVARGRRNPP